MRRTLFAIALMLVALSGCTYGEPSPYRPPAYYPDPGATLIETGRFLYARDCSFCHGNNGRGTRRGPALTTPPNGPALTHFVLTTGRMPIDSPDDPIRRREPLYPEEHIAAIVAHVEEEFDQVGPDVPLIDLDDADLGEGEQLYQENCAACHATTGIGGAMLATRRDQGPIPEGIHIPDVTSSTPTEVAEAIRTGPGTMPIFPSETLSHEDLEAIVGYVRYLADPVDRGGAPIGRIGPVAEGAIGWLVGLGILLIVIRWIGTKAGES